MRYFGRHNFIGRPIAGYLAPECILTAQAARALAGVQAELAPSNLSLVVYDCYRPQRAVDEFLAWGRDATDQKMKAEFYPRVDKASIWKLIIDDESGHTRGSTVDLAIVPVPLVVPPPYRDDTPKIDCAAPVNVRWRDGSLDFGTAFDCMDVASHIDATTIPATAKSNRALLHDLMLKYGFKDYQQEWSHCTHYATTVSADLFEFTVIAPAR